LAWSLQLSSIERTTNNTECEQEEKQWQPFQPGTISDSCSSKTAGLCSSNAAKQLYYWLNISCGKSSINLLKSVGLPENWEGLLFVMHYKPSTSDVSCDGILRMGFPPSSVLSQQDKGRMMPGTLFQLSDQLDILIGY